MSTVLRYQVSDLVWLPYHAHLSQNFTQRQKHVNSMHECNLTLNKSYFTARQYDLSDQFTLSTIDYKQIESIITSMPSNKAPGIYKIPIRVIKDCLNPIVHTITSIPGGGGALPYLGYTGTCRWIGYGFFASLF